MQPQLQSQKPTLPLRKLQLDPLKLDDRLSAVRAACNTELVTFGETLYPAWRAGLFHEYLGSELEKCLTGETKRLCISCPPQHGKSRETSVIFPSWALTKHPTKRIFQAGFSGDLSKGFSREARALVQSERYLQLYPALINSGVNRQDYWQTSLGGYYYATSVGGGSGMPSEILIIDDAHKNREEAESPTMRQKVWDWVTSVALPRLSPDGVLIVVQTRWNDDDLIGRLTNRERSQELLDAGFHDLNFKVIKLPALCEDAETDPLGRQVGEALWPEVRTARQLEGKRIEIGVDEFNCLYQQKPRRQGGNQCDINDIVKIDIGDLPPDLPLARGWDLALTAEQASDYSAGARGAVHKYKIPLDTAPDGTVLKWQEVEDFYLVHMHRGKRKWAEQKQVILDLGDQEAAAGNIVGLETVAGFKIGASELQTAFQGRCIVKSINVHKDKVARANAWIAKIPVKRFFMVRGPWNKEFLSELDQFPHGVHDDQVDAVSVLYETVHKKKAHYLA